LAQTRRHAEPTDPEETATTRRCLVAGTVKPKTGLIRFVVSPEGHIVPDIAERLPGRGLWLTARRDIVAIAVAKRLFGRAARRPVVIADGLADQAESLLAARCCELIGLARRAGAAQMGFVKVTKLLATGSTGLLLAAADGAADGRGKLRALAPALAERAELTAAELGVAFAREMVVHVAVRSGPLAEALTRELDRLEGFRPGSSGLVRSGLPGNGLAVLERE
jgi:hypothetical protein